MGWTVICVSLVLLAIHAPGSALTPAGALDNPLAQQESRLSFIPALIEVRSDDDDDSRVKEEILTGKPKESKQVKIETPSPADHQDEAKVAKALLKTRKADPKQEDESVVTSLLSKDAVKEIRTVAAEEARRANKITKLPSGEQLLKAEQKLLSESLDPTTHKAEVKEFDGALTRKATKAKGELNKAAPPEKLPSNKEMDDEFNRSHQPAGSAAHKEKIARRHLKELEKEAQSANAMKLSEREKLQKDNRSTKEKIRSWVKTLYDSVDDGAGVISSTGNGLKGLQAIVRQRYLWSDNNIEDAILAAQFGSVSPVPGYEEWPIKQRIGTDGPDSRTTEALFHEEEDRQGSRKYQERLQKLLEEELEWQEQPHPADSLV